MNEKKSDKKVIEEVGFVASGSRPQNMKFYSRQQINTDYVMIEIEEDGEKFIYEITDVDAYNSRMEDMEFVRYILPEEDYTKYNVYRANAKPLGVIRDNKLFPIRRWFVAPPGKMVRVAKKREIAMVYGIEQCEGKQRIGKIIRHEQISVWLDIPSLLTTHMAMVGRSGQGKSNLAKLMLKYLPIKYMVFTKVNEYTNISNAQIVNLEQVSVNIDINLLKKIFELSNSEVQYLKEYLKSVKNKKKIYSDELAENVRQFFGEPLDVTWGQLDLFGELAKPKNLQIPKFVDSLCKKLESMSMEILFEERIKEKKESCIINMQNLSDKEEEIELYTYLNPILNDRSKAYDNTERIIPLEERIVIFIEEAHNYIPSTRGTYCKDLIRKIAREGRKLGIHLVLLSQRPLHIDPTTLSQCGSIISFNLTNPEDISHLMSNTNFSGDYYRNTISDLKIGECVIISDYLMKTVNCKVDFEP